MKCILIIVTFVFYGLVQAASLQQEILKKQWGELEDLQAQLRTIKKHQEHEKLAIHIAVGATGANLVAGISNIFRRENRFTSRMSRVLIFGGNNSSVLSDEYLTFNYHQVKKLNREIAKIQNELYQNIDLRNKNEDTIKWRPSYNTYVKGCKADNSFRQDLYLKVYTDSLQESMGVVLMNPTSISKALGTKGISSSLDYLLNDEAFIQAMNDCQTRAKHHALARNLILIDSTGKVVGISAAVSILKGGSFLAKGLVSGISFFSATWGMRAKYALMAIGITGYVHWVYGLYTDQAESEIQANKENPKIIAEIERIKNELNKEATRELDKIERLLLTEDLDTEEKVELIKMRAKWNALMNQYPLS